MARRLISTKRPDTLTQTFFIHQLFPCIQTADHTFDQVRLVIEADPVNLLERWTFRAATYSSRVHSAAHVRQAKAGRAIRAEDRGGDGRVAHHGAEARPS